MVLGRMDQEVRRRENCERASVGNKLMLFVLENGLRLIDTFSLTME